MTCLYSHLFLNIQEKLAPPDSFVWFIHRKLFGWMFVKYHDFVLLVSRTSNRKLRETKQRNRKYKYVFNIIITGADARLSSLNVCFSCGKFSGKTRSRQKVRKCDLKCGFVVTGWTGVTVFPSIFPVSVSIRKGNSSYDFAATDVRCVENWLIDVPKYGRKLPISYHFARVRPIYETRS